MACAFWQYPYHICYSFHCVSQVIVGDKLSPPSLYSRVVGASAPLLRGIVALTCRWPAARFDCTRRCLDCSPGCKYNLPPPAAVPICCEYLLLLNDSTCVLHCTSGHRSVTRGTMASAAVWKLRVLMLVMLVMPCLPRGLVTGDDGVSCRVVGVAFVSGTRRRTSRHKEQQRVGHA